MRALAAKTSNGTWAVAAKTAGTYQHRLERIALRLHGCALADVEGHGLRVMFDGERAALTSLSVVAR